MGNRILAMLGVLVLVTVRASAQAISTDVPVYITGTYTANSLALNSPAYLEGGGTGDLAGSFLDTVLADTSTLTNLSSTPTTEPINNFFQFSSSTSPEYRYDFDLQTLAETDPVHGTFQGTGLLVDSTGTLSSSAASFTIAFSGSTGSSFTLSTVATPEPRSFGLGVLALTLLAAVGLRRARHVS